MPKILMTYSLAMAASKDAANRRARKAGRAAWNADDYDHAVDTFNSLYPMDEAIAQARSVGSARIPARLSALTGQEAI